MKLDGSKKETTNFLKNTLQIKNVFKINLDKNKGPYLCKKKEE